VSLNVLITAGSRRVPLVQGFQRALRATGGGAVTVSDVNPLSPTVYVAEHSHAVPLSTDPAYIDAILEICRADRIGLVVPTIDDELLVFARHVDRFAEQGIRVVVSPPETIAVCDDKHATCRLLVEHGIAAAETHLPADLPADPDLPLFIKPRVGRGGVGAFAVRSQRELEFFLDYVPDPVVQRFLHGPEFTIDLLCDFRGEPLSVVPRERVVIRAGVVDRARTVRDPRLLALGLACARALRFIGAVNIQCRVVDGEPVVFEINPRFSGGIPLTIAAGADFPRMLVALARGRRVAASLGRFTDQLWMTNYETSVFIAGEDVGFSAPAAAPPVWDVA
jgi:carbamoyl-phosphate synthase large subunit